MPPHDGFSLQEIYQKYISYNLCELFWYVWMGIIKTTRQKLMYIQIFQLTYITNNVAHRYNVAWCGSWSQLPAAGLSCLKNVDKSDVCSDFHSWIAHVHSWRFPEDVLSWGGGHSVSMLGNSKWWVLPANPGSPWKVEPQWLRISFTW